LAVLLAFCKLSVEGIQVFPSSAHLEYWNIGNLEILLGSPFQFSQRISLSFSRRPIMTGEPGSLVKRAV
jgi:hypothetical protein